MPIMSISTEVTVDDLLHVVEKLDPQELAKFEAGFEQIWLQRRDSLDPEAADIVKQHRLPAHQQAMVRTLLFKNREEGLTEAEEQELDSYMEAMDTALAETADQLLALAEMREQTSSAAT